MNPARSFAPALYNLNWTNHWLYWVAPITASLIGSALHRYVLGVEYTELRGRIASKI